MDKKHNVILKPQDGSQNLFVNCPIFEILLEGNRGGGKSLGMLIKFIMHVGKGYGASWTGIIFRPEFEPLKDIIQKSLKFIPKIFPGARFLKNESCWVFPEGEILRFGYGKTGADAEIKYLGNEFAFLGFEELTTWADSEFYDIMKSCLRSANSDVPRFVVSNTNPFGAGFAWVKKKFIDPDPIGGKIIRDEYGNEQVRIHSSLAENKILMENDPLYINTLRAIKNPARRKAWLFGSWEQNSGGYFENFWDEDYHFIDPFPIPQTWYIDRTMDWGSSHPFSIGWWAESDGSPIVYEDGTRIPTIKGDLFRIYEWYGCTQDEADGYRKGLKLSAKVVAERVKQIDEKLEKKYRNVVRPGYADSQIFQKHGVKTIAEVMQENGVIWNSVRKGRGSREGGLQVFCDYLETTILRLNPEYYKERGYSDKFVDVKTLRIKNIDRLPMIQIFNNCEYFKKIITTIQIDDKNPDDVDPNLDHLVDEVRYRLTNVRSTASSGQRSE